MNNFDRLKKATDEGWLRLTCVSRLPRAASTALGISLSGGKTITEYFNRPFSQIPPDFDIGARQIIDRAEHLRKFSPDGHVHIVIADAARRISPDNWEKLQTVSAGTAFVIRDPMLQFQSLIERVANDLICGFGSREMNFDECMKHAEQVDNALKTGGMIGKIPCAPDYGRACWRDMESHILHCKKGERPFAVVDGNLLPVEPAKILNQLSGKLNLGFCDKMLHGWDHSKYYEPNVLTGDEEGHTAYTGDAHSSSAWRTSSRPQMPLSKFPEGIRNYIKTVALPIYQQSLALPEAIYPITAPEIKKLLMLDESPGSRLMDYNPVMAYALANALLVRNLSDDVSAVAHKVKEDLRSTKTDFLDAFDILDEATKHHSAFVGEKALHHERQRPNHHPEAIEFIAHSLVTGANIADIGAGGGNTISKALLAQGFELYMVEPSADMQVQLKSMIKALPTTQRKHAQAINGTGSNTSLPDHSVNAVMMANSARWIAKHDLAGALREFDRIIKPGAKIIIAGTHPDPTHPASKDLETFYERHPATRSATTSREERSLFGYQDIAKRFIADAEPAFFQKPFTIKLDKEQFKELQQSRSFYPSTNNHDLSEALDNFFDQHACDGQIELGYKSQVTIGQRLQQIVIPIAQTQAGKA